MLAHLTRASIVVLAVTLSAGCGDDGRGEAADGGGTESGSVSTATQASSTAGSAATDNGSAADCVAQPDGDEDGFDDAACGGDDCNDDDAMIHPGAIDGPWSSEIFASDSQGGGLPPRREIRRAPDGSLHLALGSVNSRDYWTNVTGQWVRDESRLGGAGDCLGSFFNIEHNVAHVFWHCNNTGGTAADRDFFHAVGGFGSGFEVAAFEEPLSHRMLAAAARNETAVYVSYRSSSSTAVLVERPGEELVQMGIGDGFDDGSIELDATGAFHVVATGWDGPYYATNASGELLVTPLTRAATRLELDDGGRPVLFGGEGNTIVQQRVEADGSVTLLQEVDPGFEWSDAMIDDAGVTHVVAREAENRRLLFYASNETGSFVSETMADLETSGFLEPMLVPNPDGPPDVLVWWSLNDFDNDFVYRWWHALFTRGPDGIDQNCDGSDG